MGRSDADPQSGHRPLNIRFIRGDSQKAISVVAGLRFFIDPCLEGELTRLRALEAEDVDLLYVWENDPAVWGVSGTLAPFSRHTLRRFLDEQRFDLYAARQLRLVVETLDGRAVGLVDLFEFEPVDLRAGIGILIHGAGDRGRGFASDALDVLCRYARQVLGLHQLWCSVAPDNAASLTLFRRAGFVEMRPQAGMAPHARRLGRRTAAAKNLLIYLLKPRCPKVRAARYGFLRRRIRTAESGVR